MKYSLQLRLILSYLAVALITVGMVSVLIRLTSGQSLMNLVLAQQTGLLRESVQDYFLTNGSLNGFSDYYNQIKRDDAPLPVPGTSNPPLPPRGVQGLVDSNYRAMLPTLSYAVGDVVPADRLASAIPVEVSGQTVAWILQDTRLQFRLNQEEQGFLERTTLAIMLAGLAGVLLAVAMGFMLSGRLLQPISRLTHAARAMAQGNLEQQAPVTTQDELGELTAAFNQMSVDLAHADQQRKRMTADITHDLSTPLQIISGYIEMLEDHEVALTPQRIEILKTEIGHLHRLVGDLTTLSQVEAGGLEIQLRPLDPVTLLEKTYISYQPIAARQGVQLTLNAPERAPSVRVDEGRMLQVLHNLVDNALRYSPDGGRIILGLEVGEQIRICVTDSGAGIDPEDLPYVFNRFYRADTGRAAHPGKMGLGLAICKALVTAQGGVIAAESAGKGLGATMTITLDICPESAFERA